MMKKAIFAALLLSAAAPIYGQTPSPEPTQQKAGAFTDEEKRQALEALKNIAGAFGDPKAAPAAAADQKKVEPKQDDHKTVGDVADKALDISTKYIGQVVGVLEKAAPHVWRVMVMQQYAKAIGNILAPGLAIVMILIAATTIRRLWKEPDDLENIKKNRLRTSDEHDFRVGLTIIIPTIACLIMGAFFIYNLAESSMYLINPEYYALRDLVTLLLHPGSM